MHDERSDEELLVAIGAGPGALPEFYRRHVAKVTGMGVRRFDSPEDVADFVADVFMEVMRSAGRYDPRRGAAVSWLYGLAGNVAAGTRRRQARLIDAERRLAGRALLDAADYIRVEERIDAAAALRHTYEAMQRLPDADRRLLELITVDKLSPAEAAEALGIGVVAARVRLLRARARLRALLFGRVGTDRAQKITATFPRSGETVRAPVADSGFFAVKIPSRSMRSLMIAIWPDPKHPEKNVKTKDGGPILSFQLDRVPEISVVALDGQGQVVAHGVAVPNLDTAPTATPGPGH